MYFTGFKYGLACCIQFVLGLRNKVISEIGKKQGNGEWLPGGYFMFVELRDITGELSGYLKFVDIFILTGKGNFD